MLVECFNKAVVVEAISSTAREHKCGAAIRVSSLGEELNFLIKWESF